jgi:Glycosyl transferase family 2
VKLKTDLTVILPIYNPPAGWENKIDSSIEKLLSMSKDVSIKFHLINDGSSVCLEDGFNLLRTAYDNVEITSYPVNKGKGFALKTGLNGSDSEHYIYTDWDFPFGEKALFNVYDLLKQSKSDLVIGVRSKDYYSALPFSRRLLSRGLRFTNFFLLNFKAIDTQAGIKGLNNDARHIFVNTKTNGFIFELEFIRACFRKKMSMSYLNVSPRHDISFNNISTKTIARELNFLFKLIFS